MKTDLGSLSNLVKEARRKNSLAMSQEDRQDIDELLWTIEFFISKSVALTAINTNGKLLTLNNLGDHHVTKHYS